MSERRSSRRSITTAALVRMEAIAEEQCPASQRVTIADADGVVIRAPLAVPDYKRGGFCRADGFSRMAWAKQITPEQFRAGCRFRDDAVRAQSSVIAAAGRSHGGSSDGIKDGQIEAIGRMREAYEAMGRRVAHVVDWIVLGGGSAAAYASFYRSHHRTVKDRLEKGLEILIDCYGIQRRQARKLVAAIDATVVDIPQERLGRVAV